jgi:pimeloyl-ACP methyl ester carboxylesterase
MTNASKPTVVLVHGAFADAFGWSAVYGELTARDRAFTRNRVARH